MGKTRSRFWTFLVVFSMIMSMGVSFGVDIDYDLIGNIKIIYETSTNDHTQAKYIWSDSNNSYIAVASTHKLDDKMNTYAELGDYESSDVIFHNIGDTITIGNEVVEASAVTFTNGNTDASHWNVYVFEDIIFKSSTYDFSVEGIGGGHDIKGSSIDYYYTGPLYNVLYDSNTGEGTQTDDHNYEVGEEVTVLNEGSMTKIDHSFISWNTQANGGGTEYDPADTFDMPAENVTLYAQWEYNGPEDVIVTFDENYTGAPSTYTRTTEEGTALGETMPDDPTRTNYDFLGWNTESDGTGSVFIASTTVTAPITVYAQWEEIDDDDNGDDNDDETIFHTVTFVDYDGEVLKVQEIEEGNDATPPSSPRRPGYTFDGWIGDYTNVTEDRIIEADYDRNPVDRDRDNDRDNDRDQDVTTEEVDDIPQTAPPVVTPPVETPPVGPPEVVEIPEQATPAAAPTLPKTGSVGAGEMAGIGALLMAIGVLLKKKKGF